MNRVFPIGAALCLAACDLPVPSNAISGTPDSQVLRLTVGMSESQVGRVVGPYQFESVTNNVVCRSYIYDEMVGAKFIHATFVNDTLVSASDGHSTRC